MLRLDCTTMSEVEKLRLDVINAAREVTDMPAGSLITERLNLAAYQRLASSVDALDEAETPDSWELLRIVVSANFNLEYAERHQNAIRAALAWKEAQQ